MPIIESDNIAPVDMEEIEDEIAHEIAIDIKDKLKIKDNTLKLVVTENDSEEEFTVVEFSKEEMKLNNLVIKSKDDHKTISFDGRDVILHGNLFVNGVVKTGLNECVDKEYLDKKLHETCIHAIEESKHLRRSNMVLISDQDGCLCPSESISKNDLDCLKNIKSNVQVQIDGIAKKFNNNKLDISFVGDGKVDNKHFNYLSRVNSDIQKQLDEKQKKISWQNRIEARCLASGRLNDKELDCLIGTEKNIQHQLNSKQKKLSRNSRLHANCIGNGYVTDKDFNCLKGMKGMIQEQLDILADKPNFKGIPKCPAPTKEDPNALSDIATTKWCEDVIKQAKVDAISNFNKKKVMMSDETGKITSSEISNLELSYLMGVRDGIQKQIDEKQNKFTRKDTLNTLLIGHGNVQNSEFSCLKGILGNIQKQLDCKQSKIDHHHPLDPHCIGHGFVKHKHFDCLKDINGPIQYQIDCREKLFNHTHRLDPQFIGHGYVTHKDFDCLKGTKSCIQEQLDCKERVFSHKHRLNPIFIGKGEVQEKHFNCLKNVKCNLQDQLDCREYKFGDSYRLNPKYIGFGDISENDFSSLRGIKGCIQEQLNCRETKFNENHRLDTKFIGGGEICEEEFICLKGLKYNIQKKLDYLSNKPCFKGTPSAPDKYTPNRRMNAKSDLATKAYVKHKIRGVSGFLSLPDEKGEIITLEFRYGLLTQIFNAGDNWSGKFHR